MQHPPPRKPMGTALTPVPSRRRPGRALDEEGRIVADMESADALNTERRKLKRSG